MIETVLTLTYTTVLLLIFAYPAMVSAEWLMERFNINQKYYKALVIGLATVFALATSLFLKFA